MANNDGEPEQASEPVVAIPFTNHVSDVPSYYADTCIFATDLGSTIRLQFSEFIPGAKDSNDPGMKARYVGTLIMPLEGFRNMMGYLNQSMERQAQEGSADVE